MIQSEENDYVGMSHHIQGDLSGRSKLPVDFVVKSTVGLELPDGSPCTVQNPSSLYYALEPLVPGGLQRHRVHDVRVPVHHALLNGILHPLLHASLQRCHMDN